MGTTDAESTSAAAGPPTGREAPPSPAGDGSLPAVETQTVPGRDRTTTIRLPLISATFTRPARPEGQEPSLGSEASSLTGRVPAAGSPAADEAASVRGVPLARAAFYAGAVALGALEVVEWPVTLLVVAGTYLADQVRGSTVTGARAAAGSLASTGPVPPASAGHPAGS